MLNDRSSQDESAGLTAIPVGNVSADSKFESKPQVIVNNKTDLSNSQGGIRKVKKYIGLLGVILLVISVISGVILVQNVQDIRRRAVGTEAWQGPAKRYSPPSGFNKVAEGWKFSVDVGAGEVIILSSNNNPKWKSGCILGDGHIFIIDGEVDVVTWTDTPCPKDSPDNKKRWKMFSYNGGKIAFDRRKVSGKGIVYYKPGSSQTPTPTLTMTPTPTPTSTPIPMPTTKLTPTPTVTSTPSPTPTLPPEITARCSEVIVYDVQWNRLSSEDLSKLTAGDIVIFAVYGQASSGVFDRAKFSVNQEDLGETSEVKPGTQEFYVEYVIPEATTSFAVWAQIRHSELEWL